MRSAPPRPVPSHAFEATSASGFGDEVQLDGTKRRLTSVPITLNIYDAALENADGSITTGSLIARTTQQVVGARPPDRQPQEVQHREQLRGRTDVFNLDSLANGCWGGYEPNVKVVAS